MARWIKGQMIYLWDQIETGTNPLGKKLYKKQKVPIKNVIIAQPSTEDVEATINLTGRKAEYLLGIPKGDKHDWDGKEVEFYGKTWRVIGTPTQGMPHMMPLDWNKKVLVERYE